MNHLGLDTFPIAGYALEIEKYKKSPMNLNQIAALNNLLIALVLVLIIGGL